MRFSYAIFVVLRICYAAPRGALRDSDNQTIRQPASLNLSLPSALSSSAYFASQLTNPLNASPEHSPNIRCDGESYGFNPNIADCMTAIQYFLPSRAQTTYAQRGTPAQKGTVFPLPLRIMGGMDHLLQSNPDSVVAFIPDPRSTVLSAKAQTGTLSLNEMRDAAVALVRQCGVAKSRGGLAINIGGDGNMGLVMGVYKPQILCRGIFPSETSCTDILYGMHASTTPQIFGPHSDPTASVNVPHTLGTDDSRCIGRILSTSGNSDTGSWFSIWEAAAAIFSKCLRHGSAGVARGLGDNNELFLTMTASRLLLANVSNTVIV